MIFGADSTISEITAVMPAQIRLGVDSMDKKTSRAGKSHYFVAINSTFYAFKDLTFVWYRYNVSLSKEKKMKVATAPQCRHRVHALYI